MSNAPPVQEPGSICPNCGAYRPTDQAYCANCGFGRPVDQDRARGVQTAIWIVLFIIFGIPAGCLGGCFLMLGMGTSGMGADPMAWGITLGGLAVFALLLWAVIASARRRPK